MKRSASPFDVDMALFLEIGDEKEDSPKLCIKLLTSGQNDLLPIWQKINLFLSEIVLINTIFIGIILAIVVKFSHRFFKNVIMVKLFIKRSKYFHVCIQAP